MVIGASFGGRAATLGRAGLQFPCSSTAGEDDGAVPGRGPAAARPLPGAPRRRGGAARGVRRPQGAHLAAGAGGAATRPRAARRPRRGAVAGPAARRSRRRTSTCSSRVRAAPSAVPGAVVTGPGGYALGRVHRRRRRVPRPGRSRRGRALREGRPADAGRDCAAALGALGRTARRRTPTPSGPARPGAPAARPACDVLETAARAALALGDAATAAAVRRRRGRGRPAARDPRRVVLARGAGGGG